MAGLSDAIDDHLASDRCEPDSEKRPEASGIAGTDRGEQRAPRLDRVEGLLYEAASEPGDSSWLDDLDAHFLPAAEPSGDGEEPVLVAVDGHVLPVFSGVSHTIVIVPLLCWAQVDGAGRAGGNQDRVVAADHATVGNPEHRLRM